MSKLIMQTKAAGRRVRKRGSAMGRSVGSVSLSSANFSSRIQSRQSILPTPRSMSKMSKLSSLTS